MLKRRKNNKLPKISIVIPSYNKKNYIGETLQSIVDQKYSNLEVLIQDGGSTDGTLDIIKEYAKKHPKIFYWESKKDKGQVDAINKGLKNATGDIITYLNSDDVYEDDTLEYIGNHFLSKPKTKWLVGKGRVIDEKGNEIFKLVSFYKNTLLLINNYSLLLIVNYIYQPSVFFRKSVYKKHKPFKGVGGIVMEYEMWLKLGKEGVPVVSNKYFSKFRLTKEGFSSTQYKEILGRDLEVVKRFTGNPLILLIHRVNNLGRIIIAKTKK